MSKIQIMPPPATIEDKKLSVWANSAYSTMKSLIIKTIELERKINFLSDKVSKS